MEGIVKKIISDKGFGFIEAENGDLFFHGTDFENGFDDFNSLVEGESKIEYDVATGRDGKDKAINLRVV